MSIFTKLSENFNKVRDIFWSYPDIVIFDRKSWVRSFQKFYKQGLPLSNFVSITLIFLLLFVYYSGNINALLSIDTNTLIEGEVVGVDANGNLNTLNRINPLVSSNVQLEKDVNELIYEPLIKVDTEGQPYPVLADFVVLEAGSRYQFKLKQGIKWHDGQPLTVDDVIGTVNLLKSMEQNPLNSNLFSKTANKIDVIKSQTDPYSFEFDAKNGQVIPGFFESISFKIMPAHLLSDINADNISMADPYINRIPVGTGPYRLASASGNTVSLTANQDYWDKRPEIQKIEFKLFPDEATAITALTTGQIHGLTNVAIANLADINQFPFIQELKSNVIYNQYWGLYFNMGTTGPVSLKDVKVRQAIAMAINRDEIVNSLAGLVEVAHGPIPKVSFAFSAQEKYTFNIAQAIATLDGDGYVPGADGIRAKGSERLSFDLTMVNNQDRQTVADQIKANLKQIGIEVNIVPTDLQGALNDHILTHNFDLMLYGVQTLIDPDRYQLFDSNQIDPPGLNFGSYTSAEQRTQIVNGKTAKVPAVDDDLEDARRLIDETARAKKYEDFQRIIAAEVPVVFLFHPQEFYLTNKRVQGVDLGNITSIEQRFDNITEWTISPDTVTQDNDVNFN